MRFVDLFAGLGGFHHALASLGHECVFSSELDEDLRSIYRRNFAMEKSQVHGDIRVSKHLIPEHDILCAGFPCQPFSKSGSQNGRRDRTRGTLFHEILEILARREPQYVILENVGNFERHNNGRTWKIVRDSLRELGYNVRGTLHLTSGGHGLISPHHFGHPHTRERFFLVASFAPLADDPFPRGDRRCQTSLDSITQAETELNDRDLKECALTDQQIDCVDHWNKLLRRLPRATVLPSFPIWGDEIGASYPYERLTPHQAPLSDLRRALRRDVKSSTLARGELLALLPSYARSEVASFPAWKIEFIRKNREWFRLVERHLTARWKRDLSRFPPSLRKLEWNCQGEERDLWRHVLQFRPSGLRVKRYSSAPALVAMTETQIPILGPRRRFISRVEGLRLQGFPDSHALPHSRGKAFAALGNAVHVDVVRRIACRLIKAT